MSYEYYYNRITDKKLYICGWHNISQIEEIFQFRINDIPLEFLDYNLICELIKINRNFINKIPEKKLTEGMLIYLIYNYDTYGCYTYIIFDKIPKKLLTQNICDHLFNNSTYHHCIELFYMVPLKFVDSKMIIKVYEISHTITPSFLENLDDTLFNDQLVASILELIKRDKYMWNDVMFDKFMNKISDKLKSKYHKKINTLRSIIR